MNSQIASPDPFSNALFLVVALSLAGLVHSAWLHSPHSHRFASPIDGGKTYRGQPVFGKNKTWRGLMVMPLAGAFFFAALAALRDSLPSWYADGLWHLPVSTYAWLGLISGLSFMLAELPNSFLKRRLSIPPGGTGQQPMLKLLCFVFDRVDSVLGVLLALSVCVPMTLYAWLWALIFGAAAHGGFSVLLYVLGVKARPL